MNKLNDGKQVRLTSESYELLREAAFRQHKPMTEVVEELINQAFATSN